MSRTRRTKPLRTESYVPPSRRYREARAAAQNRDAIRAERAMRELRYSDVDIREELERIRSDSYKGGAS